MIALQRTLEDYRTQQKRRKGPDKDCISLPWYLVDRRRKG